MQAPTARPAHRSANAQRQTTEDTEDTGGLLHHRSFYPAPTKEFEVVVEPDSGRSEEPSVFSVFSVVRSSLCLYDSQVAVPVVHRRP